MTLHARSRAFVHSQNRQSMWKQRAWRSGACHQLRGRLPAPLWIIRRRRDKYGFHVRRIGHARFLERARRDRHTVAILQHEAAAHAYRARLLALAL